MLLYDVLGVSTTATPAEIKAAYRQLARELHPDVTHGDEAKAKRWTAVQQAYKVLSDPAKRSRYDSRTTAPTAAPLDPAVAAATTRLATSVLQHTEDLGKLVVDAGFARLKNWVRLRLGGGKR